MDAPNMSSLTKLKPKTLAIIAVGGIGLGLAWRHFSGKSTATVNADGSLAGDTSTLGLPGSSTGALAGSTTGDQTDTGTTRDVGTITFPVVKWVIDIDGEEFLTDGTNIWPLNGAVPSGTVAVKPNNVSINPDEEGGWVSTANRYVDSNTPLPVDSTIGNLY